MSYIVKGEEVVIVDEFTGRTMPGRRWSDGLHQAVEAKEGLPIQNESLTLASVSYQAFFRGFPKLAGALRVPLAALPLLSPSSTPFPPHLPPFHALKTSFTLFNSPKPPL